MVVDDTETNIDILVEILGDIYDVVVAMDGQSALEDMLESPPDLILLDIVMPGMNGYEVCRRVKADEMLKNIPIIFITAKHEVEDETRGLELGAIDYLTKPISPPIVQARVKNHLELKLAKEEIEQQYRETTAALNQRNIALAQLGDELQEAVNYVKRTLPDPRREGAILTDWRFIPSASLGGDAFGYHWLDDENFAIYLLDVSGHGVGAALLSVSVLNILRSQSLARTDFMKPGQVLGALNDTFPGEANNDMFFTMWYGIYNTTTRDLTYASAGHPPALLLPESNGQVQGENMAQLRTRNYVIGGMPDIIYKQKVQHIDRGATLYIYSDGVYEITRQDGSMWRFSEFTSFMSHLPGENPTRIDRLYNHANQMINCETFEDDFTILEVVFG